MKLKNCQAAQDYVTRILNAKGYRVKNTTPANWVEEYKQYTHCVITTEKNGERVGFYMLFKHKFFLTYGRQFDDAGFGESINMDCFRSIERSKTLEKILFVYPDGMVLYANPDEWKSFVEANNTVRLTRATGEATTSVRLDVLNRWDRDMTTQDLEQWLEKRSVYGGVRRMLENAVDRIKRGFGRLQGG